MLLHSTHLYRAMFRPSETLERPWLMVGVPVIAAETDRGARSLLTTPQQRFLRLIRNQPVELMPPVDSMDSLWNDVERAAVESRLREAIVGSDATVSAGLEKLIASTGADEVIVVTDTWDHEARLDSYRRVGRIASDMEAAPTAGLARTSR
jgi:alkanesulfonate monooxygenase SsuD/methylene tetrahydromethanopterin reductase-like flavin-dependent oxidoreductase (luciferase family)